MATGKTNARWMRLIIDEFDLSGFSRTVGSFGSTFDEADVVAMSDGWHNVTLGHPTAVFDGYQAIFATDGTNDSHDALANVESRIISLPIGIKAVPAVGDPVFMTQAEQISYLPQGSDGVLVDVAMSKDTNNVGAGTVWGVLLAAGASLSSTTNGTSVDNGASSADGAVAYLHITATSSGNWAIKVQDSPDDAVWSDLITFSADGSTITSEAGTVSGTVDRYLRFQATRTAGTTTFWVSCLRN
ncbi:MAG: hypothetical protein ACE5FD_03120 [Anaerolineae bacterium]